MFPQKQAIFDAHGVGPEIADPQLKMEFFLGQQIECVEVSATQAYATHSDIRFQATVSFQLQLNGDGAFPGLLEQISWHLESVISSE